MRVNGKPAETMAQSVAQCTATEKAPPQGAGLRWVNRFSTTGLPPGGASVTGKMTRALALAGPLTKRRAKPLVSVSAADPGRRKAPPQGAGLVCGSLKWGLPPVPEGQMHQRQACQLNAEPHGWLRTARTKKPRQG